MGWYPVTFSPPLDPESTPFRTHLRLEGLSSRFIRLIKNPPQSIFRGGFNGFWPCPTSFPAEELPDPAFWLPHSNRGYSRRYCAGFSPACTLDRNYVLLVIRIHQFQLTCKIYGFIHVKSENGI